MTKHIARYAITSGLAGCYMPDNGPSAIQCDTRRDLADAIRYELEFLEFPKSAIRQISLRKIWGHIARHGSSVAHFSIQHKVREVAFHGLTDAEFEQAQADDC